MSVSEGPGTLNEEELIEQIAAGNESALEELHHLYYERLIRFLYRLTADKGRIVEIVNDTLYAVWNSAAKFRKQSAVSTWIFGIAYKKGLQNLSRRKQMPSVPFEEVLDEVSGDEDDTLSERNNAQLLQQLSPHHRAVMELTYHFGYSYKEIAEIVGCPENTVKTRMFHGRQRLREIMQEESYVETI